MPTICRIAFIFLWILPPAALSTQCPISTAEIYGYREQIESGSITHDSIEKLFPENDCALYHNLLSFLYFYEDYSFDSSAQYLRSIDTSLLFEKHPRIKHKFKKWSADLLARVKREEEALVIFDQLITERDSTSPPLADLYHSKSQLLYNVDRLDESIASLKSAVQYATSERQKSIILFTMGQRYKYIRDYDKAIENIEEAIDLFDDPKHQYYWIFKSTLGGTYYKKGDFKTAKILSNEILESEHAHAFEKLSSINDLSNISLSEGNHAQSLGLLKRGLSLAVDNNLREKEAEIYGNRGMYYYENGQYQDAIDDFTRAREIFLAQTINDSDQIKNLIFSNEMLVETYLKSEMSGKGFQYFQDYIKLSDSLSTTVQNESLQKQRVLFEDEIKAQKVNSLELETKLKSERIRGQHGMIILTTLGMVLACLAALFWRQKRASAQEKANIEQELRLIKESEALLLNEENERLIAANDKLSQSINRYKSQPKHLLQQPWTISSPGNISNIALFENILAVQTEKKNRIQYFIHDREDMLVERRSLANLEKDPNWPKDIFYRIYQSNIVNLYHVEDVHLSKAKVKIKGLDQLLDVSVDRIDELIRRKADITA